ncbi:transcription elongation factor GreAB [Pseudomonas putida]|nr:transcription elongation factor GreAB [Pseudomonas putida]
MSTNIITTEGHEALKKELDHLWRVYRPEITQKVTWAASLGDRSENADLAQSPQRHYYFHCSP